jgi:hypothetical protein
VRDEHLEATMDVPEKPEEVVLKNTMQVVNLRRYVVTESKERMESRKN